MAGKIRLASVLLIGTVLCCAGCQSSEPEWPRIAQPIPAPDFHLEQLDGGTVALSDYHGKIVLIEFWATWCGPCRSSMPSLEHIYRRFQNRGVQLLFINEGENPQTMRRWLGKRFTARILLDSDQQVARRYQVPGLPSLFIVDPNGDIVYVRSGYRGGLERSLTRVLEKLLNPQAVGS